MTSITKVLLIVIVAAGLGFGLNQYFELSTPIAYGIAVVVGFIGIVWLL